MATISTDTFLDAATGTRTAGESWTINGCKFTIRTDTRVYSGAPAGMTGSLGTLQMDSGRGGSVIIDGTKVRWLPFDSGSGTVPAIGSQITQGATSGYLLGVWADYTSAPAVAGSAMPATGFMKFREVTNAFSSGPVTGISANASGPDVTGWLEVVMDASSKIDSNGLGDGLTVNGSWFSLGSTNGIRGQTFSTPTNGGGANTHVIAVQIETAPGSGVFEWYPTATSPTATVGCKIWANTNIAADLRSKIVESVGNGVIRIGSDGTNDVGYLPPAGCAVRMPNVLGKTVATTTRATNSAPGAVTRANMSSLKFNLNGFHTDFQIAGTSAISVSLKDFACENVVNFTNAQTPISLDNCCFGGFTAAASTMLTLTALSKPVVKNVKCFSQGAAYSYVMNNSLITDGVYENIELICAKPRGTNIYYTMGFNSSDNVRVTNVKLKGGGMSHQVLTNSIFTDVDYVDRMEGPSTTTQALHALTLAGSSNITIDGFSYGEHGLLANTNNTGAIVNSQSTSNVGIKIRNIGSRLNPLQMSSSTIRPTYVYSGQNFDSNIKIQRVYISEVGGIHGTAYANANGMLVEDCFVGFVKSFTPSGRNCIWRKVGIPVSTSTPGNNNGLHWVDYFTSDTAGAIKWYGGIPSVETQDKNYLSITPVAGSGYIPATAGISLDTQNDFAFSESQWMFLGHTGFQNVAPTMTQSTTGLVLYYDLDTGSGFSETWKQATGPNLSSEIVSPTGFKMRLKVVQTGNAIVTTALQTITFATTSSVAAQAENMYPLDVTTLSFEGLKPGSEVRAYVGSIDDPASAVEIGGIESTAGDTWSFTHTAAGQEGYIMIFAMGYQPLIIPRTYQATDSSLLIQQVIDRNYFNN